MERDGLAGPGGTLAYPACTLTWNYPIAPLGRPYSFADAFGSMRAQTSQVPQQMLHESDDLGATDGPGEQPEAEVPPVHPGHGQEHLPVEVVLQHRGLAFRRPGSAAMGLLVQSALMHEDDGSPLHLDFS